MEEAIREYAHGLGFDLVGFTVATPAEEASAFYQKWVLAGFAADMDYLKDHIEAKRSPESMLPGAKSIIAVGLNYNQPLKETDDGPKISRYALGRDYHKVLRAKLKKLSAFINQQHPDSNSRICVDSAPIMERTYAQLAGLGWFGKNTLLINSQRGSWFFLGLILTTAELKPDQPALGGCGTCRACVDACPTGAIVQFEGRWAVNSGRCISYLTIENRNEIPPELAEKLSGWTFGCDICQEVCPFNHPRENAPLRAQTTTEPDFLNTRQWPTLVQLAQIQEPEWDELTQGSPVRRAGIEGLRRNARANQAHST